MSNLEITIKALQKKFGKNYIGVGTEILDTEYIRHSFGIFALDSQSGGGWPERKVILLAGKEGAAKTTTALVMTATIQAKGGKVAWLDVEHGMDVIWATKLGVKIDQLIIAQPKSIEEVSDTIEPLIMTGELDLIVLDSVVAAPSDKELEDSAEQKSMGGNAKAVGLMMRKITSRLNDVSNPVKTSVVLLNQIRDNVGGWGSPEYIPSGRALRHHSDIIIWLKPNSKPIGKKEAPEGIIVDFCFKKNRTYPPFKIGSYGLLFEGRIDNQRATIEMGVLLGVIDKTGYKYTYKEKAVTDIKPFMATLTEEEYKEIQTEIIKVLRENPSKEIVEEEKVTDADITDIEVTS